jgi:hypothetical protein
MYHSIGGHANFIFDNRYFRQKDSNSCEYFGGKLLWRYINSLDQQKL